MLGSGTDALRLARRLSPQRALAKLLQITEALGCPTTGCIFPAKPQLGAAAAGSAAPPADEMDHMTTDAARGLLQVAVAKLLPPELQPATPYTMHSLRRGRHQGQLMDAAAEELLNNRIMLLAKSPPAGRALGWLQGHGALLGAKCSAAGGHALRGRGRGGGTREREQRRQPPPPGAEGGEGAAQRGLVRHQRN
jgi:hypothetical protein